MTRIYIPNVGEEERIGSSFNHLIHVIGRTESANEDVVWDFCNVKFLHPYFLAPLSIYRATSRLNIVCGGMSPDLQNYFDSVHFEYPLHFSKDSDDDIEKQLSTYIKKTYTPLCSFAMSDRNRDSIGTIIKNLIVAQTSLPNRGKSAITYFIGELLDNIYEHSASERGFVFSQYLRREGVINLCIADEGITVYNSFQRAGLHLEEIDDNEAIALSLANEGRSTKNLPAAENRGFGISTSKRMLVDGLGGAFFMLSGGAFHRYDGKSQNDYVNLRNIFRWKGTIILLRIPVNVPEKFNYIDYIE